MDTLDFSEDEIQQQLAALGYRNFPPHRLREFKRDLDKLIQQNKLKILDSSSELNTSNQSHLGATPTTTSPPAYTKETGPQCFPSWSGEASVLHPGIENHKREALSSWRLNSEPDHQDSYARHTVAPRTSRPSEPPHRLHMLPDPGPPGPSDPGSDRLSQPTSQESSPEGGSRGKPFITRKVLRKHKGQVFVCNESVHSEDSAALSRAIWTPHSGSDQQLSLSLPGTAMYKLCPGADEESSGNDRSHDEESSGNDRSSLRSDEESRRNDRSSLPAHEESRRNDRSSLHDEESRRNDRSSLPAHEESRRNDRSSLHDEESRGNDRSSLPHDEESRRNDRSSLPHDEESRRNDRSSRHASSFWSDGEEEQEVAHHEESSRNDRSSLRSDEENRGNDRSHEESSRNDRSSLRSHEEESSGNDRSSRHASSFWSDGEEEEREVPERAAREEGSPDAAPGSADAPPNPAVTTTSDDPPPTGQWESGGHAGDSLPGSVEEEDGDDEDCSKEEDSVADEDDGDGYKDGSEEEDSVADEDDGDGYKDGSEDEDSVADEDDGDGYKDGSEDDDSVADEADGGGDKDDGIVEEDCCADEDDGSADDEGASDADDYDDSIVEDEEGGDKALAGENGGSPAPSHLTSGYGTYRPDSAGKDTEAGTIAEFDGETLAGDESDGEDLYRFYCPDSSPPPPPRLQPLGPTARSPDPSPDPGQGLSGTGHRSPPGLEEEEEWRGGGGGGKDDDGECPAPDRKSSDGQRRDPPPPQAGGSGRFPWRSALEEWDLQTEPAQEEEEEEEEQREQEQEQEPEEFCSDTDVRLIDSRPEPGCAEAVWDDPGARDPDVSGLEERLGGLRVAAAAAASARHHGDDIDEEETENEDVTGQSDDVTSQSDGHSSSGLSLTAFESYVRNMVGMQRESALKPRSKSFIRPTLGHPHTRNLKKMDPLTRYLQYKKHWDMIKVPGGQDRKALRWEIREQLAYQPPPARPRRTHVPNSYVVPTDKKRSALCWEIRSDLANGLVPPKQNYRF